MNSVDFFGPVSVLGLMSGSSLDGLDLAYCRFESTKEGVFGSIVRAETFPFPPELKNALQKIPEGTALGLVETEAVFVRFCSEAVLIFLKKYDLPPPKMLCSHGHTVFHQPDKGYTVQIGNGGLLAGQTGIPVVADFRTMDVALGGQGAPLVPFAESDLFSSYSACLNLGGIANIAFPGKPELGGFDVCPCNQLLNHLAGIRGMEFDRNGELSALGELLPELLADLLALPYSALLPPKSLGNEEIRATWLPLLEDDRHSPEDKLFTVCQYVGQELARVLNEIPHFQNRSCLVTGGGAFHPVLMKAIRERNPDWQWVIPDAHMISFKEAYCFAYLGLLRWLGKPNTDARITGARQASSGGAVYLPPSS